MNEHILVERDGPIVTIILNRPAQRNAITYAMWERLQTLARELDADPEVRGHRGHVTGLVGRPHVDRRSVGHVGSVPPFI